MITHRESQFGDDKVHVYLRQVEPCFSRNCGIWTDDQQFNLEAKNCKNQEWLSLVRTNQFKDNIRFNQNAYTLTTISWIFSRIGLLSIILCKRLKIIQDKCRDNESEIVFLEHDENNHIKPIKEVLPW
jgi:hypothetical protein